MAKKKSRIIRLDDVVQPDSIKRKKKYRKALADCQTRLQALQLAFINSRQQGVVVMEGWDASGKGGVIRRMAWVLDPRHFQVHPIAAPEYADRGRHHLRRFWLRLPAPGELAVFDRSWYGRVLVERVEKLVPPRVWKRGYQEINEFERQLIDDGIRICKLFLHITPEEQLARFRARYENPLKSWKLTTEDFRNRGKWRQYATAINQMLKETSLDHAPWHVVAANSKHIARVECLEHIIQTMSVGVSVKLPEPDPEVMTICSEIFGLRERIDTADLLNGG